MTVTIDKESWERGVRDGFKTGIRGLCPDTADPCSYWAGWSEGDAARHGEEVAVDVACICGPLHRAYAAGDPMDCQPPDPKHLAARGVRKKRGAKMTLSREEHLAWCKERALKYLPGEPVEAMTSMMSDLHKHPESENHAGLMIAPMYYLAHNDPEAVRRWIVGFN